MTIALVAASCFQGRHDPARFMLAQHGYIPGRISKSRFNLRLHRLNETVATVFDCLGHLWKTLDADGVYVIDSFPVAVCDNIRIRRAKLYRDETYRGYQASKRRYFYGLKIHLMVTSAGQPVECVLTPGSVGDVQVLKSYAYDLPPGSVVYADKAYNDYEIEDLLAEVEDIRLLPIRKKNSKRPLSASGLDAVFTVLSSQAGGDGGEPADGVVSQIASCRQCPEPAPGLNGGIRVESGPFRARLQLRLLPQTRRNPIRRNLGYLYNSLCFIGSRIIQASLAVLT